MGQTNPVARPGEIPPTRWQHRPEATRWTRGALAALQAHGQPLTKTVPRDIAEWCPGYVAAEPPQRRAFWVGFLSALAKFESTYRPDAVGGGGKWYGLLQILPATARGYGCRARSGAALKDGTANLSCAIRILAVTVPRDQAIAIKDRRWRGVAADWGPMRSARKRADMASWLRQQSFCAVTTSPRPKARPKPIAEAATGD
ncbi:lytic transglycosylase domain-containing protein [Roseovarius pelagicus]|uniref:lytic transglycosylase domain-containing protein n=1 Tax=Roseovarius pelagicus TaxID=2980108 RepID=UPI0027E456A3|nr:transglycosylase SLT domain-containing protein [Roseovarius pelagicus]